MFRVGTQAECLSRSQRLRVGEGGGDDGRRAVQGVGHASGQIGGGHGYYTYGMYSHLVIRSTEDEKAAGAICLRLRGPLLHDWHHLLRALRAVVVQSEVVPAGRR